MFARAIRGSNSIEGYNVSLDEAVAAIEDELPLDERTETWYAIKGYRDAMTYIIQSTKDHHFEIDAQYLKSLHFMMLQYDMKKNPGRWRPGSVFVIDSKTNNAVYEAPDIELVNDLVQELVLYLKSKRSEPSVVRAAMAHLNFTMIHPFSDGNGRMIEERQKRTAKVHINQMVDYLAGFDHATEAALAALPPDAGSRKPALHPQTGAVEPFLSTLTIKFAKEFYGECRVDNEVSGAAKDDSVARLIDLLNRFAAAIPFPAQAGQEQLWSASKHDEIIKRLMADIGHPNSQSIYGAFKQFANELHALSFPSTHSNTEAE